MSSKLRIIVTGMIGQYPLGGVAWDYVQYVTGLKALGHDVWYFEDTGQWPYAPASDGVVESCDYTVAYLDKVFASFDLADRWAYRFPWQDQWFGIGSTQRREVLESADLLLNISGMLERPGEYRSVKRLAYIDSDPVFTQVKIARGNDYLKNLVDAHDVAFTHRTVTDPETAVVVLEGIFDCADVEQLMIDSMVEDGTPQDVAECLAGGFGEDELKDFMLSASAGDDAIGEEAAAELFAKLFSLAADCGFTG